MTIESLFSDYAQTLFSMAVAAYLLIETTQQLKSVSEILQQVVKTQHIIVEKMDDLKRD